MNDNKYDYFSSRDKETENDEGQLAGERRNNIYSSPSMQEPQDVYGTPDTGDAQDVYSAPSVENAQDVYSAPSVEDAQDVYSAPSVENAQDVYSAPSVEDAQDVYSAPSVNENDYQERSWERSSWLDDRREPERTGYGAFGTGSSQNPGSSEGSEYRYTREDIPHRSYVDANYQCGRDMERPKSYYTPPKPPAEKKTKKKGGMGRFIAACLVCAVIGGVGGGAIVAGYSSGNTPPSTYGGSSLNISDGDTSKTTTPSTVSSGEKLTGAEIYELGCEQSVGVTTEITYRNFMGQATSMAVSGSGFIVTEDGYIVTNYHVIQTAYEGGYDVSVILYNGESYPAEIVGFEKDNDLAVLKINVTGLPAATLGNSDNLKVGDFIYAIGNPLGELSFSMTTGTVSALDRSITTTDSSTGRETTNNMFQIDAAVNEGNSGGPVYNDRGEVIGIVTAKYADTGVEGLGFAIPINDVLDMIQDLVEVGYVTGKPSFGIRAMTINSVSASYYGVVPGAEVQSVDPGSCSEKAGIQEGDIITAIGDTKVASTDELIAEKEKYKPGDTVKITVYRDGEYIEMSLTFDEETGISSSKDNSGQEEQPSNERPERESLPSVPKGAA